MDVLKAESDLATLQAGSRLSPALTCELQELYMKNAITRSLDDPILEEMPGHSNRPYRGRHRGV